MRPSTARAERTTDAAWLHTLAKHCRARGAGDLDAGAVEVLAELLQQYPPVEWALERDRLLYPRALELLIETEECNESTAGKRASSIAVRATLRAQELLDDKQDREQQAQELLAAADDVERPALKVYSLEDLLALELPSREYLFEPILQRQGIMLLHAFRGIGKTYFGLWFLYLLAAGATFLKWAAPAPRRVLLVDGEMPGAALQERLAQVVRSTSVQPPPGHFRVIPADLQPGGMPDLATPAGQAVIEPFLDGVDLVWLDNLSTLCRSGVENDAESWLPLQMWALKLRRRGIATCFVHHDNKSGGQRGTVKKEDVLDLVIALKKPADYRPSDGLRCEVHFEKNRGFYGAAAEPFEAALVSNESGHGEWVIGSLDEKMTERVAALLGEGSSYRQIQGELGIGLATVNRHRRKAIEKGLING